jgi:hypothetical protein
MLDRLMITCSVIELMILGCSEAPEPLTGFQWTMLTLLLAKLALFMIVLRRRRVDNRLPRTGSADSPGYAEAVD